MTTAKVLIDIFEEEKQAALARDAYDEAITWDLLISQVNNVSHGKPASEWGVTVKTIVCNLLLLDTDMHKPTLIVARDFLLSEGY